MSWVSGIHDSETSSGRSRAAWIAPSVFATRLPCVSCTPLGSLVEPEENWMNARSAGEAARGRPARETSTTWSARNTRSRGIGNGSAAASFWLNWAIRS